MFDNLLVGVDGRQGGRDAIELALRLAGSKGKLTLVHVRASGRSPLRAVRGDCAERREESQSLLQQARTEAGVDAELASVAASSPGAGLHRHAEATGADLIVIGSCSRGAFRRVMLGNDTRAALNGAPCAVAIASVGFAHEDASFAKIGVGYDGSPESKVALNAARKLAQDVGAGVYARSVVAMPTYAYLEPAPLMAGEALDTMIEEAESRLRELPDVHGRAVQGIAGEELASFGAEVDLLIVGSRGYGPVKRLMLGSTSNYLERHGRSSLLVLPRSAAGADAAPEQGAAADGAPAPTS